MAKKKEDKITPEGIRKAMKEDKDKIAAALAAAVSNADGSHPLAHDVPPQTTKRERELSEREQSQNPKVAEDQDAFTNDGKARVADDIEISAKDVFAISYQNPDTKVRNHIRAINSRINAEALKGGFSTNIAFTVIQNDWVNIQHILDWYRARGFQIVGFDQSTPPYGRDAGSIQYNFTISWAVPT